MIMTRRSRKKLPKLEVKRETIKVLAGHELEAVAGGKRDLTDGRVHCCSQWTQTGESTTSASVVL
jgi:hypothetical protein